jgi:protein-S-isoprenylcysteine O-methyltransferase Ste14
MAVTTLIGYGILTVFFGTEGRLRRGDAAKSFEAGEFDQRTTRYLGASYGLSIFLLLASWLLNILHIGTLPGWIGWVGVPLAISGLLMRAWANRVLGAFHRRTLKVAEGQTIIKDGPYRLVRHPGYLGMILMWVGVSGATANGIVILIVMMLICAAYAYRIQSEEKMLVDTLPGYAEYRAKTWRLIPPLY